MREMNKRYWEQRDKANAAYAERRRIKALEGSQIAERAERVRRYAAPPLTPGEAAQRLRAPSYPRREVADE